MHTLGTIICLLPLLLAAVCCGMWIRDAAPRWGWLRRVRTLSWGRRLALCALCLVCTYSGADKAPQSPVGQWLARLVTVLRDGSLRGPTDVVASAAAAAAVDAVVAQAGATMQTVSNALAWSAAEVADLEWVVTNTPIAWLQAEIADASASNLVARCDLVGIATGATDSVDCYISFNVVPASAPRVSFEVEIADGIFAACTPVTNSFPTLVAVTVPSGVSSCYWYRVALPPEGSRASLIPQRSMTFGGGASSEPLSVLGGLMIDGALGRTAEVLQADGSVWVFDGGVLVEVRSP